MALETQEIVRVFKYNSVDLEDPGRVACPTAESVRDFYAATYPEIVSAGIEGPEEKDGKIIYTFRKAVGTKGAAPRGPQRHPEEHAPARKFVVTEGAKLIARERFRQITEEGYNAAHDDQHDDGSLLLAACAYAAPEPLYRRTRRLDQGGERYGDVWPASWDKKYDKRKFVGEQPARANQMVPETRLRLLAVAGALIAAEIDRLLRAKVGYGG